MAKGLTEKQQKVLEYIIDYQKERGFPPTIRETGDAFGIGSLRGVTVHLDALVRKGFVTRDRASRSLRVIGGDPRLTEAENAPITPVSGSRVAVETVISLPLLRGVHLDGATLGDGKFEVMEAYVERYVCVPEEFVSAATENGFVMRVGATGIYGEPVVPGDLLVVRPQRSVLRGELAVSMGQGELSVQRFAGAVDAEPAGGTVEIVGRVVGLLRRY
ncbi:MAG: hypothetical protein H7Y38_00835 [Armatimonadetes bacterium]|nr:hypothetical protein [Armatimonadota bacterium]